MYVCACECFCVCMCAHVYVCSFNRVHFVHDVPESISNLILKYIKPSLVC